jgi:multiple sugar transport system permease protein
MSAVAQRRAWLPRWLTSDAPLPWLLPASALMVVFGIYPLFEAILTSLYKKNAATRKLVFDPLFNWNKVFHDSRMWDALLHTLMYTGIALLFQLVLGMLIALLLDSDRKGYGVMRAMMTADAEWLFWRVGEGVDGIGNFNSGL